MTLRYVSVCSGIESASVAWHPLGWRPLLFAEIAPFPSRVLAHHYPSVPNVGDFTRIPPRSDVDLLVGGTPCQAFSVAGLRAGLADDRGNLALEFLRLADRLRARWILWENVPGVLSSNGGRDFGSILGALGELGYGFAWRVLDAQFFGVPQRRRRVFLVGHLGDWRRAAAVLSERESLRRDTPKGRKKGDQIAGALGAGALGGFGGDLDRCGAFIPVRESGRAPEAGSFHAGLARGGCVSVGGEIAHTLQDPISSARVSPALSARGQVGVTVGAYGERAHAVTCHAVKGGDPTTDNYAIATGRMRVRKLTPRECERLQGFPDDYTAIPSGPVASRAKLDADAVRYYLRSGYALSEAEQLARIADTPRYHALGNSMAVPVMRWIGERIAAVDALEINR